MTAAQLDIQGMSLVIILSHNTIRGFVINLRHSVAHFSLEPISDKGYVHAFGFTNESEFHAVISLAEICNFVWKLAERLENA